MLSRARGRLEGRLRTVSWLVTGLLVAAILVASGVHVFRPCRVNLREFDPANVARLETAMWREYYAKRYLPMLRSLYELNRGEYGFSPWDSARIAWYAARAAYLFQPTHSREEAARALPALERYYDLIRERSGERFDPAKAASLELDWWQLRREDATPAEYGEIVARVSEEVFRVRGDLVEEAALARAEMMHYRDERRDGGMGPDDWRHIEENLTHSYRLLLGAVQMPDNRDRAAR